MGREFRLALTQENMHIEIFSPSLDPREHTCTWREGVAKARPMPIVESTCKTAKPRHVSIAKIPSHGHLKKNESARESQTIKDNGHMALNAQFTS